MCPKYVHISIYFPSSVVVHLYCIRCYIGEWVSYPLFGLSPRYVGACSSGDPGITNGQRLKLRSIEVQERSSQHRTQRRQTPSLDRKLRTSLKVGCIRALV